jgi:hypothetical protein
MIQFRIFLSSRLLSKVAQIKVYDNEMLPLVLNWCEFDPSYSGNNIDRSYVPKGSADAV